MSRHYCSVEALPSVTDNEITQQISRPTSRCIDLFFTRSTLKAHLKMSTCPLVIREQKKEKEKKKQVSFIQEKI